MLEAQVQKHQPTVHYFPEKTVGLVYELDERQGSQDHLQTSRVYICLRIEDHPILSAHCYLRGNIASRQTPLISSPCGQGLLWRR